MNALFLSSDETPATEDFAASFHMVELSRTEVTVNHWIEIAANYLDRYIVTPLLGPNQSAGL